MANNIISQLPFSATGVRPGQWYLNSTENYSTLIAPGYLNSVSNAGLEFQQNDIIYAIYDNGVNFGMFIVSENDGVFSMAVYSPNSNSFIYQNTIFVAKGGSDLNPGTSMGLPKLTINAAIAALNPGTMHDSLVYIVDDGTYNENVVLPNNIRIWAPNAGLEVSSGDALTVNDSGSQTLAVVNFAQISCTGKAINILGINSTMFFNANVIVGDINFEGNLVGNSVALINSNITGSGNFGANILNAINCTMNQTGVVVGEIGTIAGGDPSTQVYGKRYFSDRIIFQNPPSTETAGRTIVFNDSNTRIVYNNAADGNYTLPKTADVDIPIGAVVNFTQLGLGAAIFVAGAGVTIVSAEGDTVETNGAGATASAYKYTDTIWIVSGNIVAVGP